MPLFTVMKTCKLEGQRCWRVHQEGAAVRTASWARRGSSARAKNSERGRREPRASEPRSAHVLTIPAWAHRGKTSAWSHFLCLDNPTPSPKHQGENPPVGITVMMGNGMKDCGEFNPLCLAVGSLGKGQDKRFLSGNVSAAKPMPTSTGKLT